MQRTTKDLQEALVNINSCEEAINQIVKVLADRDRRSGGLRVVTAESQNRVPRAYTAYMRAYGRVRQLLSEYAIPTQYRLADGRVVDVMVEVTHEAPWQGTMLTRAFQSLEMLRGSLEAGPARRASIAKKVFLAHSFAELDRQVIDLVSAYLGASGLGVVTGERAEPREVSEKVKGRIEACDGTVVVATPRTGADLRPSPWIVGEMTYSLARGKPTLVLLDQRIPRTELGGIIADHETIPLDVEHPESVLGKLAEMLREVRLI